MTKEIKRTQACPECGGVMRYEEHDDVLAYKDQQRAIKTLGWWCSKCGEGIVTGEPLLAHERAFQEFKASVDQVMGPKEVARVREHLGLSQRRAGEVLGGGPRAFWKYESGKQAVSLPMNNLLRLLANDPERVKEITAAPAARVLSARRGPRKGARETSAQSAGHKSKPENVAKGRRRSAGATKR